MTEDLVPCTACGGSGDHTCGSCGGEAVLYAACSSCGGDGCELCRNSGEVEIDCPACDDGARTCAACFGKGTMPDPRSDSVREWEAIDAAMAPGQEGFDW